MRRRLALAALATLCFFSPSVFASSSEAAEPPAPDARTAPLGRPLEVLLPQYRLGSFTHFEQIMPARRIARGGAVADLPRRSRDLSRVRYQWGGESVSLEQHLVRHNVMGYLVIKDGAVVYENYRLGTDAATPFVSWSMAKSVVGTLVGLALADGEIASIDDLTTRYVPELAQSGYGANSLRDLMQMSSGIKFIEDYSGAPSLEARAWIEGVVNHSVHYTETIGWFRERIHPPGTRFYYASMEPVAVGWILQRSTGQYLADYFSEKIWSRMGAEHDASWTIDRPGGLEIGSCCINATVRDFARFGLLVLNGGRANGQQLVRESWVREMTQPDPSRPFLHPGKLEGKPEFGYQHYWWLWPTADRAAMARGAHGQGITVDFDDQVVIVQTAVWDRSDNAEDWIEAAALQRAIIHALRTDPRP
ncbi:MAG: serine hydrolase [Steroidobacteraceae bacterium]|nr:serine hydrolase [Steroidobacteraceae bacterium]